MARKKVKLAFIVNDSARKASYNKRKKVLLKKVEELSTLCGVQACAIVYSPYDRQPEIWPSPWGIENVLSKFEMMPELEQSKRMLNQETFLEQRIQKVKKQVRKQMQENNEQHMTMFMFQCLTVGKIVDDNMSMVDLNELSRLIEQNLKDIDKQIETLDKNTQVVAPSQVHVVAPTPPLVPAPAQAMTMNEEKALMDPTRGLVMNVDTMQRSWFVDLMNNGNGDEENPFGDVNLQTGYLSNQLP